MAYYYNNSDNSDNSDNSGCLIVFPVVGFMILVGAIGWGGLIALVVAVAIIVIVVRNKRRKKAGDQNVNDVSENSDYANAPDELDSAEKWDKKSCSPDAFNSEPKVMKKENLKKLKDEVARCAQTDFETTDMNVVAVSICRILEEVVNSFVECYESTFLNDILKYKILLLQKKGHFTEEIADKAHYIRLAGNRGSHDNKDNPVTKEELETILAYIEEILEYYENF